MATVSARSAWWLAIRPATLTASAAPVLVGTGAAWADGAFAAGPALAALVGASAALADDAPSEGARLAFEGADGIAACSSCHALNGRGNPQTKGPALAGLEALRTDPSARPGVAAAAALALARWHAASGDVEAALAAVRDLRRVKPRAARDPEQYLREALFLSLLGRAPEARALLDEHPALAARDLLHLAVCRRHGIAEIKTFDRGLQAAFKRRRRG